jgi:hypothetical protein
MIFKMLSEQFKKNFLVLIIFTFVSVVMTWPLLSPRIFTEISGDIGDPVLNTYLICWDIKAFFTHPGQIFNANFFYPRRNVLVYSEILIPQAVASVPFYLVTRNPLFTYNLAVFLTFPLSAFFMYLAANYFFKNRQSAFICGLLYGFSLYRINQLGHLQVLSCQWLPLVFLYFHKFITTRKWPALALFLLFYGLQSLSYLYLAIWLGYLLAFLFLYFIVKEKLFFNKEFVFKTLLGVVVFLFFMVPFLVPYLNFSRQMNPQCPREVLINFSANVFSYLRVNKLNFLWGKIMSGPGEANFFPGFIMLALALLSLKRGQTPLGEGSDPRLIFLVILLIFFILSFGPRIKIYDLFYNFLPGFKSLRGPARAVILVIFSLSFLAGYGFLELEKIKINRKLLFGALMVLVLVESYFAPFPFGRDKEMLKIRAKEKYPAIGAEIPEVYRWLAKQPAEVIIELPMTNLYEDFSYMYYSIFHGKKLVNGGSGFYPGDYFETVSLMKTFPSKKSFDFLARLGVRYLIVHGRGYQEETLKKMINETKNFAGLKKIGQFQEDLVFEIKAPGIGKLQP